MTSPARLREMVGEEPRYLLVKRDLYYAPNNQGYTGVKARAGRYHASEADPESGVTAIHEDDAPMFAKACWQDVQVKVLLDALDARDRRIAELEGDKRRLDYLDECNARLNAKYGTAYGWRLILNHNVNRLMLGHLEVDLADNEGGNGKLPSCRLAIDQQMEESSRARAALEARS